MRITIPDDLAQRYEALSPSQPLDTIIERQLARFAALSPSVRVVPLTGDHLQQLEHLLGGGQIANPQALVDRVRAYASLTIGKITLDLSPAQKQEIQYRATKRGISAEAVAREMCDIVLDEVFERVTPYR
jgi:hypothetical protein